VTARTRARKRNAACILLALVAGASSGCITRTVRQTVFDDGYIKVILRSQERGGERIDKGFQHPATIAPVRLAHILSRIDLRRKDAEGGRRIPAIHLDLLFSIADGMAKALQKADSSQEIVVQAIRRSKRLGLFDRNYLTSLLAYMRDDLLYIQISHSDWEVPVQRDKKLPETHVDPQAVAVEWRDPIFRKPTRTRITPSGKVVRRTILMESLEDETDYGPRPQMRDDLSPEQLRALADLEEQRRSGNISEGEYTARRKRILSGETEAP
jgi:hypothetical protein